MPDAVQLIAGGTVIGAVAEENAYGARRKWLRVGASGRWVNRMGRLFRPFHFWCCDVVQPRGRVVAAGPVVHRISDRFRIVLGFGRPVSKYPGALTHSHWRFCYKRVREVDAEWWMLGGCMVDAVELQSLLEEVGRRMLRFLEDLDELNIATPRVSGVGGFLVSALVHPHSSVWHHGNKLMTT